MTEEKKNTKLGAIVAIIVAIITCTGTICAAIIAIVPDVLPESVQKPQKKGKNVSSSMGPSQTEQLAGSRSGKWGDVVYLRGK